MSLSPKKGQLKGDGGSMLFTVHLKKRNPSIYTSAGPTSIVNHCYRYQVYTVKTTSFSARNTTVVAIVALPCHFEDICKLTQSYHPIGCFCGKKCGIVLRRVFMARVKFSILFTFFFSFPPNI